MNLETAIEEIHTIYTEIKGETFPYFLIVGAGVSYPEIPLASQIIKKCVNKCKNRKDFLSLKKEADTLLPDEKYSFWIENALPSKEIRRQFFYDLIKNSKITSSNLQIANILSSKKLFRLVVTTNFDNQIEQSLNYLNNTDYFVSRNEMDNLSINLRSDDIQIIQVHGNYKNYTFKNTKKEIGNTINNDSVISMGEMMIEILKDRAPIIVGYSGWETDVIMTSIKKRLCKDVPYKYYWFCYTKNDYEKLPEWLKNNDNVNFVFECHKQDIIKKFKMMDIELNEKLSSNIVFSRLRESFKIEAPKLLEHPLLHCENLINSLSKKDLAYDLNGWLDEYKNFDRVDKTNKKLLTDISLAYNDKNFNKFLTLLKKALSISSSLTDKEFDFVCKNHINQSLQNDELSKKQKDKLIKMAFECPESRNTYNSKGSAVMANMLYCFEHKRCKINDRFNKLYSYYDINDNSLLIAIQSKLMFKNIADLSQTEYDLCNNFFKEETDHNDFLTNILMFPDFIVVKTVESLKKEDKSEIVNFLKLLNGQKYKILRNVKKIRVKLTQVISLLEDVKEFKDPIYSAIKKNYKLDDKL